LSHFEFGISKGLDVCLNKLIHLNIASKAKENTSAWLKLSNSVSPELRYVILDQILSGKSSIIEK